MPINIPFSIQHEYLESSLCSVVLHVTPSEDNCHKFAIPSIRVMQPLFGASLIYISYEGHVTGFLTFILFMFLCLSCITVLFKTFRSCVCFRTPPFQ